MGIYSEIGKLPLQEIKTLLLSLESGEYLSKVGFEEDEKILKIGLVHIQGTGGVIGLVHIEGTGGVIGLVHIQGKGGVKKNIRILIRH